MGGRWKASPSLPVSPSCRKGPKGNSLVIEHVEGELKVYDNLIGVMTNSPTFDWHLTNLRNYVSLSPNNPRPVTVEGVKGTGFGQGGGMLGLPGDYSPPSRFVRTVAKGIMTISIDQPPVYKDVTNTAKPYTLPKEVYPEGKP